MVNGLLVGEFGLDQIRDADVRVMCYFDSIEKINKKEAKFRWCAKRVQCPLGEHFPEFNLRGCVNIIRKKP